MGSFKNCSGGAAGQDSCSSATSIAARECFLESSHKKMLLKYVETDDKWSIHSKSSVLRCSTKKRTRSHSVHWDERISQASGVSVNFKLLWAIAESNTSPYQLWFSKTPPQVPPEAMVAPASRHERWGCSSLPWHSRLQPRRRKEDIYNLPHCWFLPLL